MIDLEHEPEEELPQSGVMLHPELKGRRSLKNLKRELDEAELSSPVVQKMLVEEIERLDREVTELKDYRKRYYSMDKQNAVLSEQLKRAMGSKVISGATLAVGAAALGYAPNLWNSQPSGWFAIAFGVILLIFGILAERVQQ